MAKKKLKRKVRSKYKYTLVKNNDKSYRKRLGIYFSFNLRLFIYIILFIMFFGLGIYFVINSMNIVKKEKVYYKSDGNVDYSVCLNKNEFYEDKCLGKNMSYVASLIHDIPLKFHYQYSVSGSSKIDGGLEYEIIGKLVIVDSDSNASYFEKNYTLLERSGDLVKRDGDNYVFDKDISIDYEYYNAIATKFKSQYGVNVNSYLDIYLVTYNKVDSKYSIPSSELISLRIPLSQKAIQIKLDSKELHNNYEYVLTNKSFNISNGIYILFGSICVVLAIVYIIVVMRMLSLLKIKKSKYDIIVNKILREYDRLVVETSTLPDMSKYNILKINSFEELLDVRDNLRLPIMYYVVVKHQKAHFYILQDSNLYLHTLKAVDLDEKFNNEKK